MIRSRETNLTVSGLGFATNDDSFAVGVPLTHDRLRGFRLKADADWADSFLGINQVNVTASHGIQGLGSTDNDNPIASRPFIGRVDFSKVEGTVSRLQPLIANLSLFVSAYGQYAGTPLLTSEQCAYGGRFFGRAFDPSQLLGDHCWMVIGELRYDIATPWKQVTRLQLYGYADHGETHCSQPALGSLANQHGTSAGAGVRVAWEDAWTADLSVAKAVKARATTGVVSSSSARNTRRQIP